MPRLQDATPTAESTSGYAPVNGLNMYYEIHGSGDVPLIALHGWFSNFETDFGPILPLLAETRQVIGVEQQGHGRTAMIDRPYSYEQMADDTAALLEHLGIEQADFFGYSMGSAIAIEMALRHSELVRKIVLVGGVSYSMEGLYPELTAGVIEVTPEALEQNLQGTPWQEAYARLAPNPDDWITLITKKIAHDSEWKGWSAETIASIESPTLLIIGDSDIVRPEHVIEMFRLLGGGVPGDLTGLPKSQLAILPGSTHVTVIFQAEWLASMIEAFLNAPMPDEGG
jgi:pimeloyl-ACP methyl ester carboxylesterase